GQNGATIVTGNGTTGNNVTVGGDTTIDVNLAGGNGSANNTFQFNTLSIVANTLHVTGANGYAVSFAGATTLTGNATFDPTTANLTLAAITESGGARSLTKTGAGILTISGAGTYSGGVNLNVG